MTAKKSCQRCNAIISNKLNIETHRLHSSKAFAELTARHINQQNSTSQISPVPITAVWTKAHVI